MGVDGTQSAAESPDPSPPNDSSSAPSNSSSPIDSKLSNKSSNSWNSSSSPPPANPSPSNSSSNGSPPPHTPPGDGHAKESSVQSPRASPDKPSSSSHSSSSSSSSKNPGKEQPSGSSSDSGGGGTSSNAKQSDSNLPVIAGIVGGILALVIIMTIVACVARKKKRKSQMQYYVKDRKGNGYSVGGQLPKWGNQPPPALHVPPGGGWNAPSALLMTSGEMITSGPHGPVLPPPSPALALGFSKCTFTYDELAAATSGFTQANLLGQGGFGYVHKGVLPNGKEIAVKSLKSGSGQGEREFQAEVDIISRVHHRHLVSLVGYCISGVQRMLVYDFVPNNTLEYHLHGKGLPTMDWPTRLKIALGSAKGLAYLHEDCHPRIIHRDIKTSNILLDFKFEAMVGDFGLAKLFSDNNTHVSTRVMGTFGYLAPEYASSGKLTEKSDVFSYGVMLLELITGRRPCDASHSFMEDSLVDWARPVLSNALSDGNYDELVDPNLDGNYEPMEMARMVACAAASVRHHARRRPKMSQIVRALDGDLSLEELNEGIRPGQSMLFSSGSDYESDLYATGVRRNAKKAPMASPEYSDEYGETISEYGHHRAGSSSDGVF